ncbi:uncharacterized protein HMPREF1541_06494 [Cyphellophora europaea CBS 101466]|uniref:DUF6314 domain-containing protein n=1 Tax=Cyphellophora europaea (strain CBS 101466) TaxID=1220924 RepID=W2RRX7_CYPE1|nr:uncharacterized protein HMPREF1541_06494 [Cyphellophora europaea CBS 101466]ETN38459.1 hypothetical protein HMPREF1541_06494 [Cyphellophora europaea CBS 101466]
MSRATYLHTLWDSLAGTWLLDRDLQSANASEPSGRCVGTATFKTRAPSPVLDQDGKLHLADAEMLYRENGEFQLPNHVKVPFSKKYVWRLSVAGDDPEMSVWFTKPGTDQVDYLFHNVDLTVAEGGRVAHGSGGHLCVEDFYSTSYIFFMQESTPLDEMKAAALGSWETIHEVQGPSKDQTLTTRFTRE